MNLCRIEFYTGPTTILISIDSVVVPRVGENISIRQIPYKVVAVAYAIDYSDDAFNARLRANVDLKRIASPQCTTR